jgi:F-type H+-transporting ATPase subunit epsilon
VNLLILLPFKILTQIADVSRLVVETLDGSLGLLPHRLDCVAPLMPGILTYTTADNATTYAALDQGVLVKTGDDVVISVRRAILGTELATLHAAVVREYLSIDAQELEMRSVVAKMDSALIGRFADLRHER